MVMSKVFEESGEELKFIGDFDGLYAEESDPWGQSGNDDRMRAYYHASRNRLMDSLERRFPGPMDGLEIGCGLGYLTRKLNMRPGWSVTGMDISRTAIESAKMMSSDSIRFHVGDICSPSYAVRSQYDVVILGQCWWYLLHAMNVAVANAIASAMPDGLLVVSQAFLKSQRYGKAVADGIGGAMDILGKHPRLRLIEMCCADSAALIHRDGLLVYRVIG